MVPVLVLSLDQIYKFSDHGLVGLGSLGRSAHDTASAVAKRGARPESHYIIPPRTCLPPKPLHFEQGARMADEDLDEGRLEALNKDTRHIDHCVYFVFNKLGTTILQWPEMWRSCARPGPVLRRRRG